MNLSDFLKENRPAMLARALSWGNDYARAEDAVQEAARRVLEAWPTYDGVSDLAPWFIRIMRNAYIDSLRRYSDSADSLDAPIGESEDGYLLFADPAGKEPGALEALASGESSVRLARALGRLSKPFLRVLLVVDANGHDYGTAAKALGIPPGTVRSRLSRARAAFRRAWRRTA